MNGNVPAGWQGMGANNAGGLPGPWGRGHPVYGGTPNSTQSLSDTMKRRLAEMILARLTGMNANRAQRAGTPGTKPMAQKPVPTLEQLMAGLPAQIPGVNGPRHMPTPGWIRLQQSLGNQLYPGMGGSQYFAPTASGQQPAYNPADHPNFQPSMVTQPYGPQNQLVFNPATGQWEVH